MMKKLQAAALAVVLLFPPVATVTAKHRMLGMDEPGMYNLTISGLTGGNDAKGIDGRLRKMNGVRKVHVDFKNGMVMVWIRRGKTLDKAAVEKIVKEAGFTLSDFEIPT